MLKLMNVLMTMLIPSLLILVTLLMEKNPLLKNKLTPFECGFDPKSSARFPFSSRFFMLAIIFLIFDIEIALMFPIPMNFKSMMMTTNQLMMMWLFVFMLFIGLLHEWAQNIISWSK